jgi:hypothetical protein
VKIQNAIVLAGMISRRTRTLALPCLNLNNIVLSGLMTMGTGAVTPIKAF